MQRNAVNAWGNGMCKRALSGFAWVSVTQIHLKTFFYSELPQPVYPCIPALRFVFEISCTKHYFQNATQCRKRIYKQDVTTRL